LPAGFRGRDRARQHGARIAVEDDPAPPPVALQGKIQHAAVNTPLLMRRHGFEGMERRLGWPVPLATRAWDVLIDLAVEGHDPLDRAHREIALAPQTPDAKA